MWNSIYSIADLGLSGARNHEDDNSNMHQQEESMEVDKSEKDEENKEHLTKQQGYDDKATQTQECNLSESHTGQMKESEKTQSHKDTEESGFKLLNPRTWMSAAGGNKNTEE